MSKIYYRIIFLSLFLGLWACNKKKVQVEQNQEVAKAQGVYYQNGASIGDFQITNEVPHWKMLLEDIVSGITGTDYANALPLNDDQKMVFIYSFKMFGNILTDAQNCTDCFYLKDKNSTLYTKTDGEEVSFEKAFNSVNTGDKKKSYFEKLWNIAKEMGVEEELLNIKDWKYEKTDKSLAFTRDELYYLKDGEKKPVTEQAYRALLNMLIISFHTQTTMESFRADCEGYSFFRVSKEAFPACFDPAELFVYMPIRTMANDLDLETAVDLSEYASIFYYVPAMISSFLSETIGLLPNIVDYFIKLEFEKDGSTVEKESFYVWINKKLQNYINDAYKAINAMGVNFKPNNLMDFTINNIEMYKNLKTTFGSFFGKPIFAVRPIEGKESSLVFDIEKIDQNHLDLKFQGLNGSWADLMSFLPFKSRNVPQNRAVDFTNFGEAISDVVLVKMLLEFKSIDYFLRTFNISIFGMNSTDQMRDYAGEKYPIRLKLKRK